MVHVPVSRLFRPLASTALALALAPALALQLPCNSQLRRSLIIPRTPLLLVLVFPPPPDLQPLLTFYHSSSPRVVEVRPLLYSFFLGSFMSGRSFLFLS